MEKSKIKMEKSKTQTKSNRREIRHKRVRSKVFGTAEEPRLSVFRSNKHIFLQLIDDVKGATIASSSDLMIKKKMTKTETAKEVGKGLAKTAKSKKIKKIVFDRGGYKYHGRVKAAAEALRKENLKF